MLHPIQELVMQKRIEMLKKRLKAQRIGRDENHPDVMKARTELETLQKEYNDRK